MTNHTLKEKRKAIGLTQLEIAKKVGITETGYLNYEHGRREPKLGIAIRIANALGIKGFNEFCELWDSTPKVAM